MDTQQAPTYLTTYTRKQLLLSEAILRECATGDAAAAHTSGLMAYMQQRSAYGTCNTIPTIAIGAYPDANPFNVSQALEMINTQYGVVCSLNGSEAFAHFRSIIFQDLTPNLFPGIDLKTEPFICRLTYPDSEINVKSENVQAAIKRQGSEIMDTRVWWDVKRCG